MKALTEQLKCGKQLEQKWMFSMCFYLFSSNHMNCCDRLKYEQSLFIRLKTANATTQNIMNS